MMVLKKWLTALPLVGVLFISACGLSATKEKSPSQVYTEAAQTVAVQLTQSSPLTPLPTQRPTLGASTPLPTLDQQAPSATVQQLPTRPAATAVPPTAAVADKAEYITQNPLDGTTIPAGSKFKMIWTMKNTGATTWTTAYMLRFYVGNSLSGPAQVNFPKEVKPGDSVDLSVDLTAPTNQGEYKSTWVLSTNEGANFFPVDVTIKVGAAATATVTATVTMTPIAPADLTATCVADPAATGCTP